MYMSLLAPLFTGTMSWVYDDWRGAFYEASLPHAKMLEQLATVMDAVEVDATFYGFPKPATLGGWNRQTPANFRFAFKVPRIVTHEQRLLGVTSDIAADFGKLVSGEIGAKLGALLLQLPPDFDATQYDTLAAFADTLASVRGGRRRATVGRRGAPCVVDGHRYCLVFNRTRYHDRDHGAHRLRQRASLCPVTRRRKQRRPLRRTPIRPFGGNRGMGAATNRGAAIVAGTDLRFRAKLLRGTRPGNDCRSARMPRLAKPHAAGAEAVVLVLTPFSIPCRPRYTVLQARTRKAFL